MRTALAALLIFISSSLNAQQWLDTSFTQSETLNVIYGSDVDFAGNVRDLKMDISVPVGDAPPSCGRPLMIIIHGGSFLAGDKGDASLATWRRDFAKRGYVTTSINYRLGMFQTNYNQHCNVTQMFNTAWDCLNMTDTVEWYRAYYRGMQDAKGAIRYMIANATTYNIDRNNVFLVGESAGGFIALAATFLDTITERPAQTYAVADAPAPNAIYETTCIQNFGLDSSINSMQLQRPDLGPIEGTLHLSAPSFTIRGVANIYGGILFDLFSGTTASSQPSIYFFHQPNDLIVPFDRDKVMAGYSYCLAQPPFNCSYLINTPYVYGSFGIKKLIDSLDAMGFTVPSYVYDPSNNTADCFFQYTNPSLGGHSIDNFTLRTRNMASLFASKIDTTCSVGISEADSKGFLYIYPQPSTDNFTLICSDEIQRLQLFSASGALQKVSWQKTGQSKYAVDTSELSAGMYLLKAEGVNKVFHSRIFTGRKD